MTKYAQIVFTQGDDYTEAERAADAATGSETVEFWPGLYRGCAEWIDALLDHLAQWDSGDIGEVYDTPPHGSDDETHETNEYILSWNTRMGHAGLVRKLEAT